jgi:Fic family protein
MSIGYSDELEVLSGKLDELNSYRPLSKEQMALLNKEKRIEHIWSSNAIEGSSLSRAETAAILETGITIKGKPLSEIFEVIDLGEAYDFTEKLVLGEEPLTEDVIKKINTLVRKADAYRVVDSEAPIGEYRAIEVYPYGVEGVKYAKPRNIPAEINMLIEWNLEAGKTLHPVEYAALLHLKFVSIHPFANGNGRTGRLLMEFALTSNGYPITNIQPDKDTRREYIDALADAQRENDPSHFISFVCRQVEKELDFRIDTLKIYGELNGAG